MLTTRLSRCFGEISGGREFTHSEAGYNATVFLGMLNDRGSLSTAVRRTQHERNSRDERRRMVGAGLARDRDEPCLLRRVDAAPHPVALARSRGAADPRPLGEGC